LRLGVIVPTVDRRASGGVRPAADVLADVERAERLGYRSAWMSDHLFVERDGERFSGHDPMSLLAAAAVRTSRIELGTLVLGDPFRPIWSPDATPTAGTWHGAGPTRAGWRIRSPACARSSMPRAATPPRSPRPSASPSAPAPATGR
jgi:hypothetical protein